MVEMGYIEKRPGESGYRARYRDPLGRKHSRTFARKADAQRWLAEVEHDKTRGNWTNPAFGRVRFSAWWGSGRRRPTTSGRPRPYGTGCC